MRPGLARAAVVCGLVAFVLIGIALLLFAVGLWGFALLLAPLGAVFGAVAGSALWWAAVLPPSSKDLGLEGLDDDEPAIDEPVADLPQNPLDRGNR